MVKVVSLMLALSASSSAPMAARESCPITGQRPGQYSNLSIDLCFQDVDGERRHLEIPSPDRSTVLIVKEHEAILRTKGRSLPAPFQVGRSQEEIIWSPDAKALIVTLILGASGPASADVAFVEGDPSPGKPSLTEIIRKDFSSGHAGDRCWESANVAGLTWLDDSHEAVLVAEVPPSPHCADGGYFDAYEVSIPEGRIVKRYPMKEAIKKWHKSLGPELRDDIKLPRKNR